jgi:hypothetical protein
LTGSYHCIWIRSYECAFLCVSFYFLWKLLGMLTNDCFTTVDICDHLVEGFNKELEFIVFWLLDSMVYLVKWDNEMLNILCDWGVACRPLTFTGPFFILLLGLVLVGGKNRIWMLLQSRLIPCAWL